MGHASSTGTDGGHGARWWAATDSGLAMGFAVLGSFADVACFFVARPQAARGAL